MRAALVLALLIGCESPPPTEQVLTPAAAPAVAEPVKEAPILYEFLITLADGSATGSRVYADGRVETARQTGPDLTWKHDRNLPPAAIEAVKVLLDSDDLKQLPDQLPVNEGAPIEGATPATWRIRQGDTLRTISISNYRGVRVPVFERLHATLVAATSTEPLSTRWVLQRDGKTVDATLPCAPVQVPSLRAVSMQLLDPKLEASADTSKGEDLLVITWTEGTRVWNTHLLKDGRILRTRATGDIRAFQLAPDALQKLKGQLAEIDFTGFEKRCDEILQRALPPANPKPPTNPPAAPPEAAPASP